MREYGAGGVELSWVVNEIDGIAKKSRNNTDTIVLLVLTVALSGVAGIPLKISPCLEISKFSQRNLKTQQ